MNQNFINILKSIHFVHICRFLKLKNLISDLSIVSQFMVMGPGWNKKNSLRERKKERETERDSSKSSTRIPIYQKGRLSIVFIILHII